MFKVVHVARHVMPEADRLSCVTASDGIMTFHHRWGLIHPLLVLEMNDLTREMLQTGAFGLDPSGLGMPPEYEAWFELVPDDYMGPLRAVSIHVRPDLFNRSAPPFFEIGVRESMIDVALLREINDYSLPAACGALVLAQPMV